MRWATVMLALVVVLVAAPTWADFRAGVEAYDRGDYATAMKEWRPLAELGYAPAQVALGWMYTEGKGVPLDDKEAARWYQLAANWGSASAQFVLGVMYAEGRGVGRMAHWPCAGFAAPLSRVSQRPSTTWA